MLLAHAEFAQRGAVGRGAVTLVTGEAVPRKRPVELRHHPVPLGLGEEARGGHRVAQGVGPGGSADRHLHPQLEVVGHERLRGRVEAGQRPQRRRVGRAENVQAVDLLRPGVLDRPAHRHPPHLGGVLFALIGAQLLGVAEGVVLRAARQNHGGHRHRPRPGAAPRLVHARHPEVAAPPVLALVGPVGGYGGKRHGKQNKRPGTRSPYACALPPPA